MNPNEMGNGLTLNVTDNSNELDVSLAMDTCNLYQLKKVKAEDILADTQKMISNWRAVAKMHEINNNEIEQAKRSFRLVD
jgi:serine/threonine-protein kinase HipA